MCIQAVWLSQVFASSGDDTFAASRNVYLTPEQPSQLSAVYTLYTPVSRQPFQRISSVERESKPKNSNLFVAIKFITYSAHIATFVFQFHRRYEMRTRGAIKNIYMFAVVSNIQYYTLDHHSPLNDMVDKKKK